MESLYMGHTAEYWIELKKRAEKEMLPQAQELLREVIALRGKVNYYESRVKEMNVIANSN